jgi:ABC-type microcin C transport system permease subunit YejB
VDSKTVSSCETQYEKYAKTGLSSEEVEKNLQKFGFDEIPEKINPFRKFLPVPNRYASVAFGYGYFADAHFPQVDSRLTHDDLSCAYRRALFLGPAPFRPESFS